MKLSEAIRLGSMLGPQARGSLSRTRRTGFLGLFGPKVTEYCALGAAQAAIGARSEVRTVGPHDLSIGTPFRGKAVTRKVGEQYTIVVGDAYEFDPSWRVVPCPNCTKVNGEVFRVIPHLNDKHKWTREQIADWVETFEVRDSQQASAVIDSINQALNATLTDGGVAPLPKDEAYIVTK